MKKIICVLSVLMLVLTCGCNSRNNQSISTSSTSSEETSSITTSETSSEDESSSKASQSENSSLVSTPSKHENSSKTQNNTSSKKNNTTSQPQLKPPTLQPNKESSNSRVSSGQNIKENSSSQVSSEQIATVYYQYKLNGTIVDWFTKDDVIYTISQNSNRYLAIESESGKIIKDVALAEAPAEMHLFGEELWVSFPDLKTIKIYDFATFNFKREIAFERKISSFDVYNDYIIYSAYESPINIYRYNIKTQEEKTCSEWYFSYADVLVDHDNKRFYIGDSKSTGAKVYCYDVETLERLGVFDKDNHGYSNKQRRMFLLGDGLYWGEFKLDPNNLSRVICQYTANESWIGMLHVDENFVITNRGFYIRETCEQFLEGDFQAATITECGNIMVVEDKTLYIFTDQPA